MIRQLLYLILTFSLLGMLSPVYGHGGEAPFSVVINGRKTIPNDVSQTTPHEQFVITEDIAGDIYKINTPIHFEVVHDSEDNHGSFAWSFSDGEILTGESINKQFTSPGTYLLTLTTNTGEEDIIHTINLSVTDDTINQPRITILINGTPINIHDATEVNLNDEIAFAAEVEGDNYTYLWNFDNGDIAEGNPVIYEYSDHPFLATPVLRVTSSEGIYWDTQISLKNTQYASQLDKQFPWKLFIGGAITVSIVLGIVIYFFTRRSF